MVLFPNIENYNINVLVALGNQTSDEFSRDKIKILIIDKLLLSNFPMFGLINRFINSGGILKEAYAEVIVMLMKDNDYYIDDMIIDDILKYVSLDTLMNYGAESSSYDFSKKCIEEFWRLAIQIEDKMELSYKVTSNKRRFKNFYRKWKGDRND